MINHVTLLRSVSDQPLSIRYSALTQTGKHGVGSPPHFPVVNPHDGLPKRITERRNWPRKMKVQQKAQKVIIVKVKFESNINGIIEKNNWEFQRL